MNHEHPIVLVPGPAAARRWRTPPLALAPEVDAHLVRDAVVALNTSGGGDSVAMALAVSARLDAMGHGGPRVLVHADLGDIEWRDSAIVCGELAARLGLELLVVRGAAGGLVGRWQSRWQGNVRRYAELECAGLILPWSTPKLKFCTSERKTFPIASALKTRFPGRPIVNVLGIRREESSARSKRPISAPDTSLARLGVDGLVWNPIIEWRKTDVFAAIARAGMRLHEAYSRYGSSRVSCAYCVLSSGHDLRAAASCDDNHAVYRTLVELEAASTFGFQGERWLADTAPDLLDPQLRARVGHAKDAAQVRRALEAQLLPSLMFHKAWPVAMPSPEEAALLARVRCGVARAVGIDVGYTGAAAVRERYAQLLAEKAQRGGRGRPARFPCAAGPAPVDLFGLDGHGRQPAPAAILMPASPLGAPDLFGHLH